MEQLNEANIGRDTFEKLLRKNFRFRRQLLIEFARQLDLSNKEEDRHRALDLIFLLMDSLLRQGKYGEAEEVIGDVDVKTWSVDALISWLTSTRRASKLPARKKFLFGVKLELDRRGEPNVEGLLEGLD